MKLLLGTLLLLPLAPSAATPPPASEPAEVVRRLYRDHQPWKRKWVEWGEPSVAARYFDASLVALIRKDNEEAKRAKDMSCVDFDPFLQAQDFDEEGITEPRIRAVPRGKEPAYEVTFTGRSEAWKAWNFRAVYTVVKTKNGWRIHDIEFARGGTLRKTLACTH